MVNYSFQHREERAFTLIELLVLIAIIGVLMAILLPTLRVAKEHARRTVCAKRMNQQYLGFISFAQDHRGQLLDLIPSQFETYPCDLTVDSAKLLLHYGFHKDQFYCPSNPVQRMYQEEMWGFADEEEFVHCGYWYIIGDEERNANVPIRIRRKDQKRWIASILAKNASTAELIVDQTFSRSASSSKRAVFHVEQGAVSMPDQTNHMGHQYRPYGGNACFLDGHIQWRTFEDLSARIEIVKNYEYWW